MRACGYLLRRLKPTLLKSERGALPERRELYALQRIRCEPCVSGRLRSAIRAYVPVAAAAAGICWTRRATFLRAKLRGRRREQTHHVTQALLLVRLRHADHGAERVRIRVIAGIAGAGRQHDRHMLQPRAL